MYGRTENQPSLSICQKQLDTWRTNSQGVASGHRGTRICRWNWARSRAQSDRLERRSGVAQGLAAISASSAEKNKLAASGTCSEVWLRSTYPGGLRFLYVIATSLFKSISKDRRRRCHQGFARFDGRSSLRCRSRRRTG